MGMFDRIRINMELPITPPPIDWQSKDTPTQDLSIYSLGPHDRLWLQRHHFETKPNAPAEPSDFWQSRDWSAEWQVQVQDPPIFCSAFTGSLNFYGIDGADLSGDWWEFRAEILGGEIKEIVPVKHPPRLLKT